MKELIKSMRPLGDIPEWWTSDWIAEDGHCFYHSIAYGLWGRVNDHQKLRDMMAHFYTRQKPHLGAWMPTEHDERKKHIEGVKTNAWASEVETKAVCEMFHVAILVISPEGVSNSQPWAQFYKPDVVETPFLPMKLLVLYHVNRNHFELAVTDEWRVSKGRLATNIIN